MNHNTTESPHKTKQFIKFIAYLQIIGIILVVFGHSFHEYPDGEMGKTLVIYRMLYSFRMPLFMFVSGFLMVFTTRLRSSSERTGIPQFFKLKLRRLLFPFIVLTLVTFIPRAMMSGIADDNINLSLNSFYRSFLYGDSLVIPFLWFLQASFLLLIFNHSILTLGENAKINNIFLYITLILLFAILPILPIEYSYFFSINEAVRLGLYFTLGAAYCRFAKNIDKIIPWLSPIFLLSVTILWSCLFFLFEGSKWIFLCSIAGITMCISVAKLMEKHDVKILDHLIGANYIIFLLSWYCNVATQQILHHFIELPRWCYTILSLVSGIYIPWLAYCYIQNHPDSRWIKITAMLLGQSFKKKHS